MGGAIRGVTNTLGLTKDKDLEAAMAMGGQNAALWSGLDLPNLQWEEFTPEMFNPEMLQYETIEEDPLIRAQQLQALEKLGGLAESGFSELDEFGFQKARNLGGQMARSGSEAALQNAAARGIAGSGLEFALREKANQEGAQRAQEAAMAQAAETARQRAQMALAYQNALGNQRSQDFNVNKANTDLINQFNQANTNARNQAQLLNNQQRADAFKYNQEGRQSTAQQKFSNQVTKLGGQTGANNAIAQNHLARSAGNAQAGAALLGGAAAMYGAAAGGPTGQMQKMQAGGTNNDYSNFV